jgi:hypothetical protein
MRAIAMLLVLLGGAGCGGALSEGRYEFSKGRYSEAKQTFLYVEIAAREWDAADRAQYALYRGLTHAALGDRAAASAWLTLARAIEEAEPGSLSERDASRLTIGIEEIGMLE